MPSKSPKPDTEFDVYVLFDNSTEERDHLTTDWLKETLEKSYKVHSVTQQYKHDGEALVPTNRFVICMEKLPEDVIPADLDYDLVNFSRFQYNEGPEGKNERVLFMSVPSAERDSVLQLLNTPFASKEDYEVKVESGRNDNSKISVSYSDSVSNETVAKIRAMLNSTPLENDNRLRVDFQRKFGAGRGRGFQGRGRGRGRSSGNHSHSSGEPEVMIIRGVDPSELRRFLTSRR